MVDVVVVGAGHNGLVAACYLAMAGRRVLVLEALARPGGGSRTEERPGLPGYRFDLHSAAHNIINMTSIPEELELAAAGLRYQEMDPFSVAVFADGRRVRFHRSIEATVDSVAAVDVAEARTYRRFLEEADPVITAIMPAIRGEMSLRELPSRLQAVGRVLRRGPLQQARDLVSPYDSLLRRHLRSDLTRGPVSAFAAHAGVGPTVPGGALFALWQLAYHRYGQWHARGGAQGLTDALLKRAGPLGVEVRTGTAVTAIEHRGGRVTAVVAGEERIPTSAVIAALHPKIGLLTLPDPPLTGPIADDLAAARQGNVVQALVHVATDRLPPYPDAKPEDWTGLQSYVDHLDDLTSAWTASEAGHMPDPLPLYAFTTSALDSSLAPPGCHTVYLACPAAPAALRGGWPASTQHFVDAAVATVEARAPGFAASIIGAVAFTPEQMQTEEGWPGAHPMHLDIALDQLGPFRPTRALADHRTPIGGLYLSGAGTSPAGGIAGTPGKLAAKALLADHRKR
ncbi:MAG: phytoene desaturase family protein [Acidimicrobiales bacterium]